jgi:hypothetical protein
VLAADLAHGADDVVGVDVGLGQEAVGVVLECLLRHLALTTDEADLDPVLVHLADREGDGVVGAVELLGDTLEHVFDRELEVGRLAVLQLLADEVVLREVGCGKRDHAVDRADAVGHCHVSRPLGSPR